jgi:hypothetical protein
MNRLATLLVGLRGLLLATFAGTPMAHGQELPSADDAAWAAAIEAGSAAACQQYLEEFPAGRHAEEAFRCLIEGQLELDPALGSPDVDVY